ncbi:hypothetical protein HK098_001405 [Nowakowskiella sp. JEL0407]|nr:hypothetical protein HK098_001405 [Nowakowskiella sp. JEL0407]
MRVRILVVFLLCSLVHAQTTSKTPAASPLIQADVVGVCKGPSPFGECQLPAVCYEKQCLNIFSEQLKTYAILAIVGLVVLCCCSCCLVYCLCKGICCCARTAVKASVSTAGAVVGGTAKVAGAALKSGNSSSYPREEPSYSQKYDNRPKQSASNYPLQRDNSMSNYSQPQKNYYKQEPNYQHSGSSRNNGDGPAPLPKNYRKPIDLLDMVEYEQPKPQPPPPAPFPQPMVVMVPNPALYPPGNMHYPQQSQPYGNKYPRYQQNPSYENQNSIPYNSQNDKYDDYNDGPDRARRENGRNSPSDYRYRQNDRNRGRDEYDMDGRGRKSPQFYDSKRNDDYNREERKRVSPENIENSYKEFPDEHDRKRIPRKDYDDNRDGDYYKSTRDDYGNGKDQNRSQQRDDHYRGNQGNSSVREDNYDKKEVERGGRTNKIVDRLSYYSDDADEYNPPDNGQRVSNKKSNLARSSSQRSRNQDAEDAGFRVRPESTNPPPYAKGRY